MAPDLPTSAEGCANGLLADTRLVGHLRPQLTLPEVLVRGTVVYFALLALLRVIPKWQAGPGNIASLLFVVLLGGLAADAVKGKAESVTDLLLLVVTVMLLVIAVDWLSYQFPWFCHLAQDSPTCLIRDDLPGRSAKAEPGFRAAMRRETVSANER